MSLFKWPFVRISRPTLGNPVFIDDIVAANQAVIDGVGSLLSAMPFAIIQGCAYTPGSPGSYAAGLVWINGSFYTVPASFGEGLALVGQTVSTFPKQYSDTNTYNTYGLLQTITSPITGPGISPIWNSDMNAYRVDLGFLKAQAIAAAASIALLRGGAFLNVGNTAGTLAAGDDPRLVGDTTYFDGRYAQRVNVIEKGTGTVYAPVNPNDPVNKQYADQFVKVLAKGFTDIGDADHGGGTSHTIPLGTNLGTNAYKVLFSVVSLSASPVTDSVFTQIVTCNYQNTSFDVFCRETAGGTEHIAIDWVVIPR